MGDLFGSGEVSSYPTTLDTATTQADVSGAGAFGTTSTHASKSNNLATAIINIETELGTLPFSTMGERKNLLLNGDFRVAQRGVGPFTSATVPLNSDDTYQLDRWIFLADGADTCDISQSTATKPTGAYSAILLDVETANRKFGIFQVIEARDSARAIGGSASLSFKARVTGTSIANLRAAIVSWSSTADTVTSDIVSAWNAAGADPTLVANWTYENVPSNLAVTTSFQTFKVENVLVDTASTTNVGVFIWVDDTDATVGDFVHIGDVQLEVARLATAFEHRPYKLEESACQRFCHSFLAAANDYFGNGQAFATTDALINVFLPGNMRVAPTLVTSGAGNFVLTSATATLLDVTVLTGNNLSPAGAQNLSATVASGLAAGNATLLLDDGGALARLTFDSEL